MKNYKEEFEKVISEDIESPVSPELTPDDGAAWANSNPEFNENPDLGKTLDVSGLPPNDMTKYMNTINVWKDDVDSISNKMTDMYKYASQYSDQPGASEIFTTISKLVERVLSDLGTLSGQLKTLDSKIAVTLKRQKSEKR